MNVRFQKTAKGEVAILARADYEALVARANEADEDAGTTRIVARGRKGVANGDILIPYEIAQRIAEGVTPVRAFREWRQLTQAELSARAGISQGHVSDLENGRRIGTPATLRTIADILNVPLDLIVA